MNNIIETLASDNPNFIPSFSTDEIYVGTDMEMCLTDELQDRAYINHTHSNYALTNHTHTGYASQDDFETLEDIVDTKANSTHTHTQYASTSHSHDGAYDVSGASANALTSANAYTDSKIDALVGEGASATLDTIGEISAAIEDNQDALDLLNSAIGNKANVVDLNTHTNDTKIHITNTERNAWNAKSNFSGSYNDLTNKPNIPSIDGLATETYVDSQIDAIDIPNALSDLTADATHRLVTDVEKATWNAKSDFSGSYNDLTNKPSIPSISGLATETYVDEAVETKANIAHSHTISEIANLQSTLDSKATSDHNHNSVYYTETEVNTLLANKSDTTHNHNSVYDALGTAETKANEALNSAEEYADEIVANEVTARDSAIATAKNSAISTASSDATTKVNNHNVSTSAHNDIRTLIADLTTKLNNFLDVDDTTTDELSEIITLINNNKGTLESLTTSKINVSDIVDNLTTSNASKVLSAKQGVAIKNLIDTMQTELDSHTHSIADVSGLQSALNGKAASSHGTHVSYSTTTPVMDGTASVGSASTVARSDHKHPTDTSRASQTDLDALETVVAGKANSSHAHTIANVTNLQTTLDGKAASSHTHNYAGSSSAGGSATSANKLATARTISLTGDVSGSTSFDGSGNVSITATVADDSHNHTIANVDNLQTTLDGKASASHTHSADALIQMAEALFGTNSAGGVEYSYGSGSGKNVLTEISNMPQGFHTAYAIAGTTGNPESAESYRYFIHKTSTTIGWIWAFGADGSIYSNYLAGANTYKGWKTIHDAKRKPLWTGSYYMTAGHTATPSKKLSQCEHGWMLLWSDYDPDTSTVNNTDFCTTMIPNRNWAGGTWNGAAYYCDIPRYTAGTATDSESRIIKVLNVYDNKLVGTANNNAAPRNDVILRAVYEF